MTNPKGDLIEYCRAHGLPVPVFETRATGPEHEPTFVSEVSIEGRLSTTGDGRSKRDAERAAATSALDELEGAVPGETAGRDESDEGEALDDGPWPIFPDILVESLAIAHERVDPSRYGPEAIDEVRRLALDLYKGLLEELGEYT